MKIYLIRHATQQSILCNDNTSLSAAGKTQAEAIGMRLLSYGIDAIYSSDLLRARETAGIINDVFVQNGLKKCPLMIRSGLQEADFGILTGHTDEEIAVTFHDFMEGRYHTKEDWGYPQGENGQMVWERFEPVFNELLSSGYSSIAVVTHGGTIRCALSHLFGRGFSERLKFGKHFTRGSITELLYDEARDFLSLERFNDGAHLEPLEKKAVQPDAANPETSAVFKASQTDRRTGTANPETSESDLPLTDRVICILASGSPRRKELLERLGIKPVILKSHVAEVYTATEPSEIVKELSCLKVSDVAGQLRSDPSLLKKVCPHTSPDSSYLIIGADTIVVSPQGKILGKPTDAEAAYAMLSSLSGKTHSVHTGVTLLYHTPQQSQQLSFSSETKVSIASLSSFELQSYIAGGEPFDKAGGYGIQGSFAPYVTGLQGDYYNVVGLPLAQLRTQLHRLKLRF